MRERQFYVYATAPGRQHRAYVARADLVAEINRLLALGFTSVSADLEREQA